MKLTHLGAMSYLNGPGIHNFALTSVVAIAQERRLALQLPARYHPGIQTIPRHLLLLASFLSFMRDPVPTMHHATIVLDLPALTNYSHVFLLRRSSRTAVSYRGPDSCFGSFWNIFNTRM